MELSKYAHWFYLLSIILLILFNFIYIYIVYLNVFLVKQIYFTYISK